MIGALGGPEFFGLTCSGYVPDLHQDGVTGLRHRGGCGDGAEGRGLAAGARVRARGSPPSTHQVTAAEAGGARSTVPSIAATIIPARLYAVRATFRSASTGFSQLSVAGPRQPSNDVNGLRPMLGSARSSEYGYFPHTPGRALPTPLRRWPVGAMVCQIVTQTVRGCRGSCRLRRSGVRGPRRGGPETALELDSAVVRPCAGGELWQCMWTRTLIPSGPMTISRRACGCSSMTFANRSSRCACCST